MKDGKKMLLAAGAVSSFRCIQEVARVDGDTLVISNDAAKALNVKPGDEVRCVAW